MRKYIFIFLRKNLWVELLSRMISVGLISKEIARSFPKVIIPIYIPTSNVGEAAPQSQHLAL